MKKIIVCFFIILGTIVNVYSMEGGELIIYPSIGGGVSAGSSSVYSGAVVGTQAGDSNLFNDADSPEYNPAYNLGIGMDYFINSNISLMAGLYYESKPFQVIYPKKTATNDLEVNLNFTFLTGLVGARYYFQSLYIGGGIYYAFVLSDDANLKSDTTTNVTLDSTNNDIGLVIDFGMNFDISEESQILVFLRYKRGFVKVYDEEDMVTDIQLMDLTINVGYGFRI